MALKHGGISALVALNCCRIPEAFLRSWKICLGCLVRLLARWSCPAAGFRLHNLCASAPSRLCVKPVMGHSSLRLRARGPGSDYGMLYESDRNNRGLTLVERGTVKYAGERDCIHREQRDGLRVVVGRRCPQCAGSCPKPPDGALGTATLYLGESGRTRGPAAPAGCSVSRFISTSYAGLGKRECRRERASRAGTTR